MQKLTVKEFSVIQDSIEFVKQWRRDISSDQDLQLRLENFVAKEKLSQTKQSLELLWSAKEYRINMEKATLFDLLETPFMMEIVMQVLPKVAEQFTLGVKNKQSKQEMFTTYNFYEVFLDQYFDRQIYKLQQTENIINAKNQLWDFAQRLAIEMTIHNLSQVNFASNGLVYKKVKSDWRDQFFDDDDITGKYKRLFRQCIPLRQKLGNYSFNHKSIQEFLVAKWFIDNMDRIEEEKYYSEFNWSVWNLEWFEGIFKFIRYKTGHDELIKIKLYTILTSIQQPEQFVIAKSNSIYILQKLNFDFRGKKLQGIKIKDVNLKNINLRKCCLDFSNFENVQLSNVNLEHASLYKCKWTNLRLDEDDSINFQVGSIDKIHIGVDKIYFLNAGKIQSFNFLKKVNKFYDCCVNVLDYDILQDSDKDELIYINEDSIAYEFRSKESNLYLIPHSQKWFLGDQVKQIIKCKDDNQYHWYIINGKSLKILKFEINHNVCEVGEYCLVKCDDFKTPIAETTKLIAYKNNFILATHPGSLISLYNMKSDQIIFQNKYINQGNIVSIAINDDGQYIIGGSDCSLKLYQNGQESNKFFGHYGVVTILQVLENKYFLSASQEDHQIQLWSIYNQQSLWKFVTSINITSIAFSQKQKLLFIGSAQGIIYNTGILCCHFHEKKNMLASGSKDNVIKVWDLISGKQLGSDMIHGTPLCLHFDELNDLYSCEQQGSIVLWNMQNYTIKKIVKIYGDLVTHFYDFRENFVYRSSDSILKSIDVNQYIRFCSDTSSIQFKIDDHLELYQQAKYLPTFQEILDNSQITQITRIVYSIKSQYFAYGMANGNLVIQHKYGLKLQQQIVEGQKIIELIELQDEKLICVSQQGYRILKINQESIECLVSCNFKNTCSNAILQKNPKDKQEDQQILILVDDQNISLRDLKTVKSDNAIDDNVIKSIPLKQNTLITTIAVTSSNTQTLYCGTQQGTIQLWDIINELKVYEFNDISKLPITKLIYLEQSNQLIASSEDGNVYFMNDQKVEEKQLQSKIPIRHMEVSEDERFIILAHSSNLTLWDMLKTEINKIDSFGEFKDVSALSVNFDHQNVLIGDSNTLFQIPLSLRRISQQQQKIFNFYPICFCVEQNIGYYGQIVTGDNFGNIGCLFNSLSIFGEFWQVEKQRINQLVFIQGNIKILVISYDKKIVLVDYNKRLILYEVSIQSEFSSCMKYYGVSYDVYYGADSSLNCISYLNSTTIQITKRFNKFDKIISLEDQLIVYSEQSNSIKILTKKSKQFSVLQDNSKLEFKFNQSVMQDSVIQDQSGKQLNQLFLSCGAINLSELQEQQNSYDQ